MCDTKRLSPEKQIKEVCCLEGLKVHNATLAMCYELSRVLKKTLTSDLCAKEFFACCREAAKGTVTLDVAGSKLLPPLLSVSAIFFFYFHFCLNPFTSSSMSVWLFSSRMITLPSVILIHDFFVVCLLLHVSVTNFMRLYFGALLGNKNLFYLRKNSIT